MEKTMLRLSRLAAGVGLGMMLMACGGAGDPNDPTPADPSAPNQNVAEPVSHTMEAATGCVTFQRGVNGTVHDTELQLGSPDINYGAAGTMAAGANGSIANPGATRFQSLLYFDLSSIPGVGITVEQATLTLTEDSLNTASPVSLYRVTNPPTSSCTGGVCPGAGWSETVVTWNTFGGCAVGTATCGNPGAYDHTTVWSTFTSTNTTQIKNIDVSSLVQAWLTGTYPNHGFLIDETPLTANHSTFMPTSESTTRQFRPKLLVCYSSDAGHTGTALLTGGSKSSSPFYQGVLSLGESPGGNFLQSPSYTFHGGVVGATQPK